MKLKILSYYEMIDRYILGSLTPFAPELVQLAPYKKLSLRRIYGAMLQKSIVAGLPSTPPLANRILSERHEYYLLQEGFDLLITCNAPILSGSFLKEAAAPVVNIHFGLTHAYRGMDTVFWPLYRKDSQNIGLTFHYVDAGIDTGRILVEYEPELTKNDTEITIWRKLSQAAHHLLPQVITRSGQPPKQGHLPSGKGPLFQSSERTIAKEVEFRWRELWQGHDIEPKKERTTWHI